MKTSWFTFGQNHVHRSQGRTFDCDVVVKITAEDPRARMFELFGDQWAMEYHDEADVGLEQFYPRGVVEVV